MQMGPMKGWLSPFIDMFAASVLCRVAEGQEQLYGDPSRRNLQAALPTMQKLAALVESAYTQTLQA
eukprot:scaffold20817_cov21-Tisochrysis_lutea.AAC.2